MDGMGCALASYLVGSWWGVFFLLELLYVLASTTWLLCCRGCSSMLVSSTHVQVRKLRIGRLRIRSWACSIS
jgi:hypothetical protein